VVGDTVTVKMANLVIQCAAISNALGLERVSARGDMALRKLWSLYMQAVREIRKSARGY
jgi:hypothetical protein